MNRTIEGRLLPMGEKYGALTDHRFWDGQSHYWTGMAVKGMEDQDPLNHNCCPDLGELAEEEVELDSRELRGLRGRLRERGYTHSAVGRALGVGLSFIRQRLYGQRPFSALDYRAICHLVGIRPKDRVVEERRED
ncbi:hypothetical protein FDZ71_14850 [bacterium]|nr:MAG: hypothetical protein FDZ71_14850 [bacterium]